MRQRLAWSTRDCEERNKPAAAISALLGIDHFRTVTLGVEELGRLRERWETRSHDESGRRPGPDRPARGGGTGLMLGGRRRCWPPYGTLSDLVSPVIWYLRPQPGVGSRGARGVASPTLSRSPTCWCDRDRGPASLDLRAVEVDHERLTGEVAADGFREPFRLGCRREDVDVVLDALPSDAEQVHAGLVDASVNRHLMAPWGREQLLSRAW